MSFGYRPLVFFWIAEYENGKALPQFDPETGEENRFIDVDLKHVKRFGWYPFTPKLAVKIEKATGLTVIPSNNPIYTVTLKNGEQLIAKRHNVIKFNMKGGILSRKTFYVLGKVGDKILIITEDGKVISDADKIF